jgi:serine/threonine protein kinase
MADLTQLTTPA